MKYTPFSNVLTLISVSVDPANTKYDSRNNSNAIINKTTNELITGCKYTKIPEDVVKIGGYAFAYSPIEAVEIPSSVSTIDFGAFSNSSLKSVVCKGETPPTLHATSPFSGISSECKLTVPRGTRQVYIEAGWTEDIFKGGVVEEDNSDIIEFADTVVKAICVANWDTNGDGELSKEEAAAVTTLIDSNTNKSVFYGLKAQVTSFDEFQYFTGLTTLEDNAFYGDSIRSIVLPSSLTEIKQYAIAYCAIKELIIPDGVTHIGDYGIYGNRNLEYIRLSKNLKSISIFAFGHAPIQQIFIPKSVNSITFNTIFVGCKKLASIAVDEDNEKYDSRGGCSAIILKSSSGDILVHGCKNTVIPEGVAMIGNGAFREMGLTKIEIPASVNSIDIAAFTSCALDTLVMKRTEPITFNYRMFNPWTNPPTELANCVLVVPAGTLQAYNEAGWKTIDDGGNFKEIVEEEPLSNPDIIEFADANVKAICVAATTGWDTNGDGELSKQEAAAVTTLRVNGTSVFKDNTTITSFDEFQYFTGLTSIEEMAFYECSRLKSVVIPKNVTSINDEAFLWCSSLSSIVLPEGLTEIGSQVFRYCSNLKEIKLSESITTLGSSIFNSSGISMIYIPKNVSMIFAPLFTNCYNLKSIVVDDQNTTFDSRNGCNGIIVTENNMLLCGNKYTTIPEGVTSISMQCFDFDGITSLVLPRTITSIETGAINECLSLSSVVSKIETPFTLSYSAFSGIKSNCVLTVPYGKRQAYIDAGWTESIFKGGIVEDKSQYDTNGDKQISIADVTKLVNVILGK